MYVMLLMPHVLDLSEQEHRKWATLQQPLFRCCIYLLGILRHRESHSDEQYVEFKQLQL